MAAAAALRDSPERGDAAGADVAGDTILGGLDGARVRVRVRCKVAHRAGLWGGRLGCRFHGNRTYKQHADWHFSGLLTRFQRRYVHIHVCLSVCLCFVRPDRDGAPLCSSSVVVLSRPCTGPGPGRWRCDLHRRREADSEQQGEDEALTFADRTMAVVVAAAAVAAKVQAKVQAQCRRRGSRARSGLV